MGKFTQTGITTLRFESIDNLETHFSTNGRTFHQHRDFALAARDPLLARMEFGETRFQDGKITVDEFRYWTPRNL
ncbi:MAG: hypothetical protein AB7T38_11250 [Nitrospirales bacterium]